MIIYRGCEREVFVWVIFRGISVYGWLGSEHFECVFLVWESVDARSEVGGYLWWLYELIGGDICAQSYCFGDGVFGLARSELGLRGEM